MFEYLDLSLNRNENIVLVVDSINRPIESELLKLFPKSTILRPEKEKLFDARASRFLVGRFPS